VENNDGAAAAGIARLAAELSNAATGEFKTRLDNVSNTWLLTTVAKLDHAAADDSMDTASASRELLARDRCIPNIESPRCMIQLRNRGQQPGI